jgi:hypothetical protein
VTRRARKTVGYFPRTESGAYLPALGRQPPSTEVEGFGHTVPGDWLNYNTGVKHLESGVEAVSFGVGLLCRKA